MQTRTHSYVYVMRSSRQLHITYTLCQLRKKSGLTLAMHFCLARLARNLFTQLLHTAAAAAAYYILSRSLSAEPSFCSGKWAVNQLLNLLLYGLLSWLRVSVTLDRGGRGREGFHYKCCHWREFDGG